jgi:hypothetical protein
MSRAPSTFKQRDLTKAIKAAVAAGVDIARVRVEITKAGSMIISTAPEQQPAENREANEWDHV